MGIEPISQVSKGCNPECLLFVSRLLPFRARVHFLVHSWSANCYSGFRNATLVAIRAA